MADNPEDLIAGVMADIASGASTDLAVQLQNGARLGVLLAGVYNGLMQGGVPSPAAIEIVKTLAVAGFRN